MDSACSPRQGTCSQAKLPSYLARLREQCGARPARVSAPIPAGAHGWRFATARVGGPGTVRAGSGRALGRSRQHGTSPQTRHVPPSTARPPKHGMAGPWDGVDSAGLRPGLRRPALYPFRDQHSVERSNIAWAVSACDRVGHCARPRHTEGRGRRQLGYPKAALRNPKQPHVAAAPLRNPKAQGGPRPPAGRARRGRPRRWDPAAKKQRALARPESDSDAVTRTESGPSLGVNDGSESVSRTNSGPTPDLQYR